MTCQCGRGDVVGVLIYRLGGAVTVHPLHWAMAVTNAADWRCADCVADACRLLPMSPTRAYEEIKASHDCATDWPCASRIRRSATSE